MAPVLGVHHVVAGEAAALVTQRRVDGFEAAVEPDVVHVALGDPFGDRAGRAGRDPRHRRRRREGQRGILRRGQLGVEPQLVVFGARSAAAQAAHQCRKHRCREQRGDRGAQGDVGNRRGVHDQPLAQREIGATGQSADGRVGAGNVGNGDGRINRGGVRTGHVPHGSTAEWKTGGMWNPDVYLTYADHRGRPFFDLMSRVAAESPRRVVDLGCGPGNLTVSLAQRWPDAVIEAWDSSPEMVDAARERGVDAHVGDVRTWAPQPDTDVVLSNAVLQWVPGHAELLVRWAGQLSSGSWIAMQVPGNFDAPSHEAVRRLARQDRWSEPLQGLSVPGRSGRRPDGIRRAAHRRRVPGRRVGDDVHSRTHRRESGAAVDHRDGTDAGEEPARRRTMAAVPRGTDPDARRGISRCARTARRSSRSAGYSLSPR